MDLHKQNCAHKILTGNRKKLFKLYRDILGTLKYLRDRTNIHFNNQFVKQNSSLLALSKNVHYQPLNNYIMKAKVTLFALSFMVFSFYSTKAQLPVFQDQTRDLIISLLVTLKKY
jgi:hypothetical protein